MEEKSLVSNIPDCKEKFQLKENISFFGRNFRKVYNNTLVQLESYPRSNKSGNCRKWKANYDIKRVMLDRFISIKKKKQ